MYEIYKKYESFYDSLLIIIRESERRVVSENGDDLFSENVNFFVKSYMINMCSYLEAYIQDVAFEFARHINERLNSARIPHNYLCYNFKKKKTEFEFKNANYPMNKKLISDEISANPYKTIDLYKILGIDLFLVSGFKNNLDYILSFVQKRNKIIHNNDNAIDFSFSDLINSVEVFKEYMCSIKDCVESELQIVAESNGFWCDAD